jgi:hypothetical protein
MIYRIAKQLFNGSVEGVEGEVDEKIHGWL